MNGTSWTSGGTVNTARIKVVWLQEQVKTASVFFGGTAAPGLICSNRKI